MRTSLTKRICKLEGATMQMQRIGDDDSKSANLSMLSMEELDVLEKVVDYTLRARPRRQPANARW